MSDNDYRHRRPENAPDMMTECPICFEPLFDNGGIAEKEVAKIMCTHLVHSDCLKHAGKALNADGSRYGIGGLGAPRCGCPVCSESVTFWMNYNESAAFPVFWMQRIQTCLEQVGPQGGPISVDRVVKMLEKDPNLTQAQKKYLIQGEEDGIGFYQALFDGYRVWVNRVIDGGPENGGSILSRFEEGIWDWDQNVNTLWLHKWAPVRSNHYSLWIIGAFLLAIIAAVLGTWTELVFYE